MRALLLGDTSPESRRVSSFLGGFLWLREHQITVPLGAEGVLSPEGRQLGCARAAAAAPIAALTRAGSAVFASLHGEGFFSS